MENLLTEEWLLVEQLNRVAAHLKATFVGKDDIIDLMCLCLVGRENLFLLGPPGTSQLAEAGQMIRNSWLGRFQRIDEAHQIR